MSKRTTKRIDPSTGSYVMTDGAWEMDDTGFSQIYLAIMTKYGSVPADTTLGDRLMTRATMSRNMAATAKKDLEDAVQYLIDDGIIDSFEVVYTTVNASNPTRLDYGWHHAAGGVDHYADSVEWDSTLTIGTE